MEQYIPKSVLVAEIERKINEVNPDNIEDWRYRLQRERDIGVMKNILSLINTLEVKEVDLEQETQRILDEHFFYPEEDDELKETPKLARYIAKHFFELGLKVQKGE